MFVRMTRKNGQNHQKERKYNHIQSPVVYDKHTITAYSLVGKKYHIRDVLCEAKKHGINIYHAFINYCESNTTRMAYHVKHHHELCKKYPVNLQVTPQSWGNVHKIPTIVDLIEGSLSPVISVILPVIYTYYL